MRNSLWILLASLLLLPVAAKAGGGDLKIKATLVWGCNDPMPKADDIKPVSADLAKRLSGIFKWKHYYYVDKGQQEAKVAENRQHKFVLSPKCTVDVKNMGKTFEAKLHGEGKLLKTLTVPAKSSEDQVLAGDGKDNDAWFVILASQ